MTGPAPGMSFQFEWERGEGVAAPELAATWARLEIWIGRDCITQLEDVDSRSSRRSLYCSLYPLAEWAAYNWWFLQAHVRPASLIASPWSYVQLAQDRGRPRRWLPNHNLRGVADGFPWPNLTIVPEGELTRLIWAGDAQAPPHAQVRYLGQGQALLPSRYVEGALTELVEAVTTRLEEERVDDTALQREWQAISESPGEERAFCIAAARLGTDPYSIDPAVVEQLGQVAEKLESRLLEEFLDSVDPNQLQPGLEWVEATTSELLRVNGSSAEHLTTLVVDPIQLQTSLESMPWDVGYAQAKSVRAGLNLEDKDVFDVGRYVVIDENLYTGWGLQALGGRSQAGSPAVLLGRPMREAPSRFAGARSLWHFLVEPERQRFLITDSHTDRQRIERAFAAEMLAPASGIAEYLPQPDRPVTQGDVEEVATHFRVSPMLVQHQLENQLGLTVAD